MDYGYLRFNTLGVLLTVRNPKFPAPVTTRNTKRNCCREVDLVQHLHWWIGCVTLVGGHTLGMKSPAGPCLGMFTAILVSTLAGGGIVYGEFGSARIIRFPWNLYVGVVSAVMWSLSKALVPPPHSIRSPTLLLFTLHFDRFAVWNLVLTHKTDYRITLHSHAYR